jgi:hypothetical protein
MILTAKECFSVMEDRDYLTIVLFILFCLSVAGIYTGTFSRMDAGLFLMAAFLARFFFIYRKERLFESFSKEIIIRMDKERATPEFKTGNLSLLLEKEFRGVSKSVKNMCIRKFVEEMEIDLGPDGNYMFYPTRVYDQPGKDRRHRKIGVAAG